MATCDSKNTRQFLSECEVYTESGPDDRQRYRRCGCDKGFISLDKLEMDDLPEGYRTEENMRRINYIASLTAKIRMYYTSEARPDTWPDSTDPYPHAEDKGTEALRCGTAWIWGDRLDRVTDEECPCPDCKKSENPETGYFKLLVITAAHVVFDAQEAKRVRCELFHNKPFGSDLKFLYGVGGYGSKAIDWRDGDDDKVEERCFNDRFNIDCVSHDMELYQRLESILNGEMVNLRYMPVIVSHPHGFSKRVSVGTSIGISITFKVPEITSYVLPVNTWIRSETDLMTKYPGFFEKNPDDDTHYINTQELRLCVNTSKLTSISFDIDSHDTDYFYLPNNVNVTSVDGQTTFHIEGIKVDADILLKALKANIKYSHFTYDTHTCSGSSGALVPGVVPSIFSFFMHHAGKMPNGINRTGVMEPNSDFDDDSDSDDNDDDDDYDDEDHDEDDDDHDALHD